jgi:peptidoglycan/LPS O-acetylase OafA/YrhL
LVLVGDSSYTLYLSHFLILSVLRHTVSRIFPIFRLDQLFGSIFAIIVCSAFAAGFYVYVENPIHRRLNRALFSNTRKMVVPQATFAVSAVAGASSDHQ